MTTPVRRISEFLPEVLQTDLLKKFFAATADHMFQPERVEYVNAYVGALPDRYDPNRDMRIPEQGKVRQDYQLQYASVSGLQDSDLVNQALLYDDLIQKLRWQGALVNDHNRLFSAEYYSLGLPVDWDKLINYAEYVWLPTGPNTIRLLSETNLSQIQLDASYTYTGNYQIEGDDPNATPRSGSITFTSGLKVQFAQDVQVPLRSKTYIVEGVGTQIRLVPDFSVSDFAWDQPEQWDSSPWDGVSLSESPAYVCMARGSVNQNPWSVSNRWFHKQVLTLSETSLTSVNLQSAQRPILEFAYNCVLRDFGTQFLSVVNIVDTSTRSLDTVVGKSNVILDSVPVDDGQIILFTNLRDPADPNKLDATLNNRLYRVSNVRAQNSVALSLVNTPDNPTGIPSQGDVIWCIQGVTTTNPSQTNVNTHWYYTQGVWRKGQCKQLLPPWDVNSVLYKQTLNQSPLFELYDHAGTSLSDPSVYPQSDFTGSTLIQYTQSDLVPTDPVLGLNVVVRDNSARNYVFTVTCASTPYTYLDAQTRPTIPGYYYWQTDQFENTWFLSPTETRQYVINEYVAEQGATQFEIDQTPAPNGAGAASMSVRVADQDLSADAYTVQGTTLTLLTPCEQGDVVRVRTWAGLQNTITNGYFEQPSNLKQNPNNLPVTEFSMSDILDHAHSVIGNQPGFVGSVSGSNNWRDTEKNQGLGTHILQHRAPLLKLMILNAINQTDVFEGSQSVTDPMLAMQWAQSEYLKFYNKFVNSIFALYNNQAVTGDTPALAWVERALKQVNLGKTKLSAWTNSGIDMQMGAYCGSQSVNPTWVPTTPARLGATPVFTPEVFVDFTQPQNPVTSEYPLSLRCHNGAILVLKDADNQNLGVILSGATRTSFVNDLSHPVAKAWLLFEQLQYDSLPQKYKAINHVPDLDPRTIWSGKFRQTSYSRADWIQIASSAWQRWLTFNQLDALRNTHFDVNNPFTWNYGACVDQDQQTVPGHYRGMYFYYYDTDRPDQAPWEMLGFSQQPEWWQTEYGAAPYTSGNLKLWQDLADGRIRQGDRQGVHESWARPGLLNYIPVNAAGELLAPFDAGIVTQLPTYTQAAADWRFGDRSPLENVWLTTADSDFLWAQWAYLARPACFVEYLWDNTRQVQLFADQANSQWVYSDTFSRKNMSQFIMHREDPSLLNVQPPSTATYYGSCGIQHWISEKLVSESRSVTQFFGNRIRGTNVNLAHRMGGFTDGNNLRVLVDSFGLTNTDNLLLPQEDVTCQLMRSASTGEYVYTGVIVEYMGRGMGWRVIGYDAVNPFFDIIPSNLRGSKQTVVVDNQTVIEYKQGLNTTQQVAYGTIFETRQQVYDFLISLGRAQEAQGWQFDQYDSTAGRPRDWSLSAREFLFWSQGPWAAGTYITLSPLATLSKFKTAFGTIQNVGDQVNGAYSVLDRSGQVIRLNNLDFLRMEDEISVRPLNDQGIYALRLYTTSLEHVLIFKNKTVFGDLIYDPVFDQAQRRFKLFGYRTLDWQGRLYAPGYLVTQSVDDSTGVLRIRNQIVPNLEKSVNDLRKIFEIDLATAYEAPAGTGLEVSGVSQSLDMNIKRLAQHMTGYQPRTYLTDLLLDNNAEFLFYLGMIKQKGTSSVIDALLRNTQIVKPTETFSYFEEWAFRSAAYGYVQDQNSLDVRLIPREVTSNPQLINLLSDLTEDAPNDDQIVIVRSDSRIVNSHGDLNKFKLRNHYGAALGDLPTAGYVLPAEVKYTVVNRAQLQQLYTTLLNAALQDGDRPVLQAGDKVWQFVDPVRGWNVYTVYNTAWQIDFTTPNPRDNTYTTVTTNVPHRLNYGDLVIIYGVVNAGTNINNTFEVVNVIDEYQFDISITSTGTGSGGTSLIYFSTRFSSVAARDQSQPPTGWNRGDLVYVDGTTQTPWRVFQNTGSSWFEVRSESLKTDPDYVQNSRLYDLVSLNTLSMLTLWDPVKNKIPGILDKEISYKTPYDPAQYTQDPTNTFGTNAPDAWGSDQVGVVWWDLNTTRFLDYEFGSDSYRRQNWGAIAPGTGIDVYEWVRSPVPPASWASLVSQGTDLSGIGSPGPASGQVRSEQTPYVQRQQQNSAGQLQTVYYFWVRQSDTVPDVSFRQLSTRVISEGLINPENLGISWWSVISDSSTLIGNVGRYLSTPNTVWQVNWLNKLEVESAHNQYDLVRPDDPRSSPPTWLWQAITRSLLEYDVHGDSVPNLRLKPLERYGVLTEPMQSMFTNTQAARRAVVNTVNGWLAANTVPPVRDTERQGWQTWFESEEPIPAATNSQPAVRVATLPYDALNVSSGRLNGYYVVNGTTHLLKAAQPGALLIDGVQLNVGDRVLVKNQQDATHGGSAVQTTVSLSAQNGIYVVVYPGSMSQTWMLQRVDELSDSGIIWTNAQTQVQEGSQALTTWHQTNPYVLELGVSDILWQQGPADAVYDRVVPNMSELEALSYVLPFGSRVLVLSDPANMMKWTIWTWQQLQDTLGEWQLYQTQTYRTTTMWTYVDWYAPGYNETQIPSRTYVNLQQRDQDLNTQLGDLVKVLNTGAGVWAWYVKVNLPEQTWLQVAEQLGGIQLSDALWDYNKYNMGFGGPGWGDPLLGAEYDSRREFAQIWRGLWNLNTQGLLKVTNDVNEPNQLMFVLIRKVFEQQTFVDWAFKTSFINLRGFAEELTPTPEYTTNKINSLLAYVNEVKPYHAKLRQFVDYRRVTESQNVSVQDFDKPPYVDPNLGVRILNEQLVSDEIILRTNSRYTAWYQNYQLNPQLVRQLKTRLIYDRVSCETGWVYNSGFSSETPIDITCTSLAEWLNTVYVQNVLSSQIASVKILTPSLLVRNLSSNMGFAAWDVLDYGLSSQLTPNQYVRTQQQLAELIESVQPSGYVAWVQVDDWTTENWFIKQPTTSASFADWHRVAYEINAGAAVRIQDTMQVTPGPLISGCDSRLLTLDGTSFELADSWDQNAWDNVRGWDYTEDAFSIYDTQVQSGQTPRYQVFVGNNTQTEFVLNGAPQSPNELLVYVNGVPQYTPQNWIIQNQVSQFVVNQPGLGYQINDVITLTGGVCASAAKFKVTLVNGTGGITQVTMLEPGSWQQVPDQNPIPVSGGSGIQASMLVRWNGDSIQFVTAPSMPIANRPNVWILEKGASFLPVLQNILETTFDGSGLNRPHLEAGHPEELVQVWPRNNCMWDVYTAGTGGAGRLNTHAYESDGIQTNFQLNAPIQQNDQIWVYVNGELKTWGPFADYVINYVSNQVVFVTPPAPGQISLITISWGGASEGVGRVQITQPGAGYQIGDIITLNGGLPSQTNTRAQVQVLAVSAQQIQITQGGSDYRVGDLLYYKRGTGTQTLVIRVDAVTNQSSVKGSISAVSIQQAGYYTNVTTSGTNWFTDGSGTDAVLVPVWGAADLYIANRGLYLQQPSVAGQLSVINNQGGASLGQGVQVTVGASMIKQQVYVKGDGVTNTITLQESPLNNQLLVTLNGTITTNYNRSSGDPRILVLGFQPQPGDLVVVSVFGSTLYSLKQSELITIQPAQLTYTLSNPPIYQPTQGLHTQVFRNGVQLRAPYYVSLQTDGVATAFDLYVSPSNKSYVKVWYNNDLVPDFLYNIVGAQIVFGSAPPVTRMVIQVQDPTLNNYDFTLQGEDIVFEAASVSPGDVCEVITFAEDSSLSWSTDVFEGTSPSIYTLRSQPQDFGQVQVWVDGMLQQQVWDYVLERQGTAFVIRFGASVNHTNLNRITCTYSVAQTARPPVAFRIYENMFSDIHYQRLSDRHSTRLSQAVTWDATEIFVQDGTMLAPASAQQPGAVWINSERIEYAGIESAALPEAPFRHRLYGLRRGTWATSAGALSDLQVAYANGDGATKLWLAPYGTQTRVKVGNQEQVENVTFDFVTNPANLVPGIYVQFKNAHIPPVGSQNIQFVRVIRSVQSSPISHAVNSVVRDASDNQRIPGGYVWPAGTQGIQYGTEPQTAFLLAEPGVRQT